MFFQNVCVGFKKIVQGTKSLENINKEIKSSRKWFKPMFIAPGCTCNSFAEVSLFKYILETCFEYKISRLFHRYV